MVAIKDSWFTVQAIEDTTFAISEYGHWEKVHSYLLIGEEQAALIDTGLGIDNIKRITNQLTNLPIIVLTTHVHWDHIGSHGEFENLYVHTDEEDWLINGVNNHFISSQKHRFFSNSSGFISVLFRVNVLNFMHINKRPLKNLRF